MKDKATLIQKIKKHKDAIAKHRDELRTLQSTFEDVIESCDKADEDLGNAIAALSETYL